MLNLGLNIPHLWGKILLCTPYNLHEIILWGFPVQLARPDATLCSLRISGSVSFHPFRRLWAVLLVWLFGSASNLSLANSYVEILAPRGDGISGWGIWEMPNSWGWNSPEGNYCHIREVLESFLAPPTMWGYSEKSETWRGLPPDHPGAQLSDFQPPEL